MVMLLRSIVLTSRAHGKSRHRRPRISRTVLEFSTARLQFLLDGQATKRVESRPTDIRGLSRMRELPRGATYRSASSAPVTPQLIFPAILEFPPLPALHTPAPLRLPLLSFASPRHASLPPSLPLLLPMAQVTVKGQAVGNKVNQQVSLFSVPQCPHNSLHVPWLQADYFAAMLAGPSARRFVWTRL